MELPDNCPKCRKSWIGEEHPREAYLLIRSRLNFDADSDDETRIESQLYECSSCHTIFRAKWKLASFIMLLAA